MGTNLKINLNPAHTNIFDMACFDQQSQNQEKQQILTFEKL